MRQIIIATLIIIFGPIANIILERYMTSAPEWVWRALSMSCIVAGIVIGLLSEPIYFRLKHPQSSPLFSTLAVAFAIAILAGGVWWFFIIPSFPSKIYQSITDHNISPPIKIFVKVVEATQIIQPQLKGTIFVVVPSLNITNQSDSNLLLNISLLIHRPDGVIAHFNPAAIAIPSIEQWLIKNNMLQTNFIGRSIAISGKTGIGGHMIFPIESDSQFVHQLTLNQIKAPLTISYEIHDTISNTKKIITEGQAIIGTELIL